MLRSLRAIQTSTALDFLFFVLLVFPDILEKSQEEIDRAVGTDRLPDFTDEQKLPYTSAVIKEILRWGAFVPTGIIRTNAADDIYKGYFIPKGSLLVPNAWYVSSPLAIRTLSAHKFSLFCSFARPGRCYTIRVPMQSPRSSDQNDSSQLMVNSTTQCPIQMRYLVLLGECAPYVSFVSVLLCVHITLLINT